jgi:hypothetical protein
MKVETYQSQMVTLNSEVSLEGTSYVTVERRDCFIANMNGNLSEFRILDYQRAKHAMASLERYGDGSDLDSEANPVVSF